MKKDYAGAAKIDEFQVFAADGVELPSDVYSKMILAVTKNALVFETRDGQTLALGKIDDDTYHIYAAEQQMNPLALKSEEHDAAGGSRTEPVYLQRRGVCVCMHPV